MTFRLEENMFKNAFNVLIEHAKVRGVSNFTARDLVNYLDKVLIANRIYGVREFLAEAVIEASGAINNGGSHGLDPNRIQQIFEQKVNDAFMNG